MMSKPIINYAQMSDTLTISFFPGEAATGVELNDNILLRMNKQKGHAVSLSIFDYSILAQKAESGFRSLPLNGLEELSDELRTSHKLSENLPFNVCCPVLCLKQQV